MTDLAQARLRPAAPADETFLVALHADVRHDLCGLGDVLALQRRAAAASLRTQHPQALERVLLDHAGAPCGRLVTSAGPHVLHLLDLAVHSSVRGQGLGTAAVRVVQQEAAAVQAQVHLHVLLDSSARDLYVRLGFVETGRDEVRAAMSWRAA